MTTLNIKGAIFDMDGTLVDSLTFWDWFWNEAGRKFLGKENFNVGEEADKAVRTMTVAQAMPYVNSLFHFTETDEEFIDYMRSTLRDYYKYKVPPKEGVIELLDHLTAKGVKLCVASATDMDNLTFAMDVCGLLKYFDKIFSCADIGVGKDKPDIYLLAQKELGLDISDICVFEDSYVALETAKKAGFKTVGIYDKFNYGQDRLKAASDIYISESDSIATLTKQVNP